MVCTNCGTTFQDGLTHCPYCAKAADTMAPPPADSDASAAPSTTTQWKPLYEPPMKMKWFKFLIYFSLYFSAIVNVISAISMFTGYQYGENVKLVYEVFPGLKRWDVIIGVAFLLTAVLLIFTRYNLARFRAIGPGLLILCYIAGIVVSVVYLLGVYIILPKGSFEQVSFRNYFINMGEQIVMIILNSIYFKKREHLFYH